MELSNKRSKRKKKEKYHETKTKHSVKIETVKRYETTSVDSIDFDTQACVLRLRGRNIVENQYVKVEAYNTLDLEINRKFELRKREWDTIGLESIDIQTYPNI
uniref:eRF1/Pelota-like N-terminal domain-containing protein n=1 Tax=Glossina austeni TaxID=7395 RepID=A0A1A9VTN1_GLOAU